MNSFDTRMNEYTTRIEQELERYFTRWQEMPHRSVLEAMRYSLLGGGKRIRGVLTLAFYRLFHEDIGPALPFAAAVEMIHAYSLIHDDLPCMDDDDLRRGKPACHIAFGEAIALLAGDGLLTLAFQAICSAGEKLTPEICYCATSMLASSAGMHGMIAGQVLDMEGEGKALSTDELDIINARKTGMLISCAASLGCIAGGATKEQEQAAREYAMRVGQAFQIMDDVLDVTADPDDLGKPTGSDRENQKNTYAALCGVEECLRRVNDLTLQAKEKLRETGLDAAFLCELADMLGARTR